jgi:ribosomal protein L40E
MVCRKCGADALRRENRQGFLQLKVFPLFGLYPWECVVCRKVRLYPRHFLEMNGPGPRSRPSVADKPRGNASTPASS